MNSEAYRYRSAVKYCKLNFFYYKNPMCGIAGFTLFKPFVPDVEASLINMGDAIAHRGPDASGVYIDEYVGLCHRRLSIIDLSETGKQPMTSHSGRYIAVYNGEIYNFKTLREELKADGAKFNGSSDTEVLLALYEKLGADSLPLLNGMFAIAIWDTHSQSLFLARDRLGKKPLYYYSKGDEFAFASEIKSILSLPGINKEIRMDAMKDFFTYQYVPDPKSIFNNIYKLSPGSWMKVDASGTQQQQYWDVSFANVSSKSQSNLEDDLYSLLEDSVKIRMISDVPLGAFLSGGVDSSAVVGLMSGISSSPITTCSIGFDSKKHDEVEYARIIAKQFETEHHEFVVSENIEDNLKHVISFFDEPFADSSCIPTFYVSRLARQKVTVALAGDGGDENFAGYTKYKIDQFENKLRGLTPTPIRHRLLPHVSALFSHSNNKYAQKASSLLNTLSVEADDGFSISNSFFREQLWDDLVIGELRDTTRGYQSSDLTKELYQQADSDSHLSKILYCDLKSYLPGDILVKVDRMSMANSLETRAPILDYRIVEFAATVPPNLKLNGSVSKHLLKESMSRLLPNDILHRKKMGFTVPIAHWIKYEIHDVMQKHLFDKNNGLSNFFDIEKLKKIWKSQLAGEKNYSAELWSLFMFELWWQEYMT